jgi:2-polyprenyl-3-methyl-5-hydroxy-6-metoxy-1,4-benzoquinol methylase
MQKSIYKSQTPAIFRDAHKMSEPQETNSCILCGMPLELSLSALTDTRFGTSGSYEIRRCVRCGLEQTFPVLSISELKKLYEAQYNFAGETSVLYATVRERFLFSFFYRLWCRLDGDISFHLRKGSGRLLDVGCNEGRGLRIYASNCFHAEGLELNETAAVQARQAGFKVHTCLFEEFEPAALYDFAVLSNVLEHSRDPRQMLRDVHRILASGGQVWISCPNGQSWLRAVFGRSWINWHVPFHIFHFSSKTLRQLIAEAGFVQIEVSQITPALWVAESFITFLFGNEGKKNRQLRNPLLTAILMLIARFIFSPALWLGNRCGRGDCLLAVAAKA